MSGSRTQLYGENTIPFLDGLVTSGPYRFVRHPQHLGIILLLLPFAIMFDVNALCTLGIRPGDILSWSLMTFLLLMVADFEESRVARILEEYDEYKSRTSFIVPVPFRFGFDLPPILDKGKPARYVFFFILYWIYISLVLFAFTQTSMIFTR